MLRSWQMPFAGTPYVDTPLCRCAVTPIPATPLRWYAVTPKRRYVDTSINNFRFCPSVSVSFWHNLANKARNNMKPDRNERSLLIGFTHTLGTSQSVEVFFREVGGTPSTFCRSYVRSSRSLVNSLQTINAERGETLPWCELFAHYSAIWNEVR